MSFDPATAWLTIGGVAIGAASSTAGGYLPGFFNRKADASERFDKQQRVAAFYRGLVSEVGTVCRVSQTTDASKRELIFENVSRSLVEAANNGNLVTLLPPPAVTAVMVVVTLIRAIGTINSQAAAFAKKYQGADDKQIAPDPDIVKSLDDFIDSLQDACVAAVKVLNGYIKDDEYGLRILAEFKDRDKSPK